MKATLRIAESPLPKADDGIEGLRAVLTQITERLEALEAREFLAESRQVADARNASLRLDTLEGSGGS